VVVNSVAKSPSIAPNSEIIVTRAGGEILLNGRTVRAIDPFFKVVFLTNHPLYVFNGIENDYRLFWDNVLASVKATGMEETR